RSAGARLRGRPGPPRRAGRGGEQEARRHPEAEQHRADLSVRRANGHGCKPPGAGFTPCLPARRNNSGAVRFAGRCIRRPAVETRRGASLPRVCASLITIQPCPKIEKMALRCGIVGLPNVGKSTLFNALSNAGAESANYPFCTIEPNVGVVPVPDARLDRLAELAKSAKKVPTSIEFVDIAGLVAGASKGEGLGNQFLAHIREVDAIVHVVRCLETENIVHVSGGVDPARDIEVIETELLLKDLETMEKRVDRTARVAKSGDKKAKDELAFYERLAAHLGDGKPARSFEWNAASADEAD